MVARIEGSSPQALTPKVEAIFDEALPNFVERVVGGLLKPGSNKPAISGYSGTSCDHSCSCHSTVQHNCRLVDRSQIK